MKIVKGTVFTIDMHNVDFVTKNPQGIYILFKSGKDIQINYSNPEDTERQYQQILNVL